LSRDQQQQDPPEQPEQLPEEAEQGRGDGGEGHLDQEGQVDQDHLGRCQPPLISVAATLCFHHHCFLPAEQEMTSSKPANHGAKEPGVEGHCNEHEQVGKSQRDKMEEGLERVSSREHIRPQHPDAASCSR